MSKIPDEDLLKALQILEKENIEDFVYAIQGRDLCGWEGERVKAWVEACMVIKKYLLGE